MRCLLFTMAAILEDRRVAGCGRGCVSVCVVVLTLSMCSPAGWSQRPFPELEDTYQIMFRVGMGGSPAIPEKLSAEAGQFLQLCLVHDPKRRAGAQQLEDHPFVKVGAACSHWPVSLVVINDHTYTFSHCESASVQLRSADCIGIVSWNTTPTKVASYRHSAPL